MTGPAARRGSVGGRGQDAAAVTVLTRRSDPTHRIAFGSTEAAERFVAATQDPDDWTLDDLQTANPTPPTA